MYSTIYDRRICPPCPSIRQLGLSLSLSLSLWRTKCYCVGCIAVPLVTSCTWRPLCTRWVSPSLLYTVTAVNRYA